MKSISIHEAEIKDCYEMAIIKRDVWNTTYKGIYPDAKLNEMDIEKDKARFEKIITNPATSVFIAKNNQKICGYMSCGEPWRPFLDYKQEIGSLYLLKEYQKQGIGKELFLVGRKKIAQNGYDKFFVSCNKYNLNAIEFYKKMGGKIIHIGEDNEDKSLVSVKFHYEI